MTKLRIDAGDLEMAMEHNQGFCSWHLDRQTGAVIFLGEDELEEEEEIRASIDADPDRYLEIPSRPSHEGYREMESFAASLPRGRAQDALLDALDRPKPFRRFKDTLLALGEVREQWFRFEEENARRRAQEWLEAEGIDAELV